MADTDSTTRFCPKCGQHKQIDEFYISSRRKDGRCPHCKTCMKAYSAKYRAENPDKVKLACAKWWAENQDRGRELLAAYYIANKDRLKPIKAEYRAANKDMFRTYVHNRRAKLASGGKLSSNIAEKLYKLQKGKCACCGLPLGDDYHLDHIMPLSMGGANYDNNIQLLRATCNQQKKAKHPVDFMRQRGFLL